MSGPSPRSSPHRWWVPDPDLDQEEMRAKMVFAYVRAIEEDQAELRERMYRSAYMYTGEKLSGLRIDWRQRPSQRPDTARINMVESLIETGCSRIGSRRPRLAVSTRGGDWDLRQRALGIQQYLEGEKIRQKSDAELALVFRDGMAMGTGVAKVYNNHGQTETARIFPLEWIVDERSCLTSRPTQAHQRRFVDVDQAVADFEEYGKDVVDALWRGAKDRTESWVSYMNYDAMQVPIIESWHLPLIPGGKGQHMVCCEGMVIYEEDWDFDHFPIVEFRWALGTTGWYGRSLPEQVHWMAARLNRHAAFESRCQDLHANPRVIVHISDAELQQTMTNELGMITPANMPDQVKFITPAAVPAEIYRDEDRKIALMRTISGMSEAQTGGRPPPGIDSQPGQREFYEQQDGRFATQLVRFDDMHLVWGDLTLDRARELAAEGSMPKATWYSPRFGLVDVEWKDVNMKRDAYRLRILPSASISDTPAGLRQRLEEERAGGRLADDLYLYLVQTLDVEGHYTLADAGVSNVMRTIRDLMDVKRPFPSPTKYQALTIGLYTVQMELNKIEAAGAPQAVLDRFEAWIQQTEYIVDMGKPVEPQPLELGPAQAGGGTGGVPRQAGATLSDLGRMPVPAMGG